MLAALSALIRPSFSVLIPLHVRSFNAPTFPRITRIHLSQERIDHGELIRWTKGFGAPNVEGHDAAAMLRESLKKHNLPVTLTALINDTTGTLIASHYVDPRTKIAVILGTGCNAAYMEKVSQIPKISHLGLLKEDPNAEIAINCEWGAFDSFEHEHLPRTKYDEIVDTSSNKPGEQAFEKMISGRYLGEIVRLVICDLIDEGVLFLGQNTYKLEKPYEFDTAFLSTMERSVLLVFMPTLPNLPSACFCFAP